VELTSTSRAKAAPRVSHTRIISAGFPAGVASPLDKNVMPAAAPTGVNVLLPPMAVTFCKGTQGALLQSALFVSTTIHPPDQTVPLQVVPPAAGHTVMP
jgi:hypothetical protein